MGFGIGIVNEWFSNHIHLIEVEIHTCPGKHLSFTFVIAGIGIVVFFGAP